jgi:hypothetical protein
MAPLLLPTIDALDPRTSEFIVVGVITTLF